MPAVMEFMTKCPNLASFQLENGPKDMQAFDEFYDLVAAKTWSHLHTLILPWCLVDHEAMPKLLSGINQATYFKFQLPPLLGQDSLDLLQPHASSLRTIDLRGRYRTLETCPIAQAILSSCPVLEVFCSTEIHGETIVTGKPWVCLKLQVLHLDIFFEANTIRDTQPRVMDQLSKLTRLRRLAVWADVFDGFVCRAGRVPLDLRLEQGLGKLSTLRSLEIFDWGISEQRMGEQECQWMLDHWKRLKQVVGDLHSFDAKMHAFLEKPFQERNIFTDDPQKWSMISLFGAARETGL
ncbi:hypothetical protein B0O80DRAFT_463852 [Mortierella sp. GBAus27b]|nr:hypothetical protein B0O80DRAFT_463852 [Mortierella sp. GBAus27b]